METIQRNRMLWRIPLATMVFSVLFWGVRYLVTGKIPVFTSIHWYDGRMIQLPFPIFQPWNIIFAPIWAAFLVFIFTHKKTTKNNDISEGRVIGLVVGLLTAILSDGSLSVGLFTVFSTGISFGLLFGLMKGNLLYGLLNGLVAGLLVSMAVGLNFDLGIGLIIGLIFGLVAGVLVGLGTCSVAIWKGLFLRKTWPKAVVKWISGK